MKARFLILIGAVALITLSFTFVQVSNEAQNVTVTEANVDRTNAPVGGFLAEEVAR